MSSTPTPDLGWGRARACQLRPASVSKASCRPRASLQGLQSSQGQHRHLLQDHAHHRLLQAQLRLFQPNGAEMCRVTMLRRFSCLSSEIIFPRRNALMTLAAAAPNKATSQRFATINPNSSGYFSAVHLNMSLQSSSHCSKQFFGHVPTTNFKDKNQSLRPFQVISAFSTGRPRGQRLVGCIHGCWIYGWNIWKTLNLRSGTESFPRRSSVQNGLQ